MRQLKIGDVTIDRITENEGPSFHPGYLIPKCTPEALEPELDWLQPKFIEPESGRMIQGIHIYVIRTPSETIVIDTGVGADKSRPSTPPWDHYDSPLLDLMAERGVTPDDVTKVVLTHLHVDHVGWNTRLENGAWVPTFRNARYVYCKPEYEHWRDNADPVEGVGSDDGCFADSVQPIVNAGQADLLAPDAAINDFMTYAPSPGHSPAHCHIKCELPGHRIVFSGDVFHHPVQIPHPHWSSRFCHDPEQAGETRAKFVDEFIDTDWLVLAAHFASPTAGHIVSRNGRKQFVHADI
jgi:glyoxylase-like metal-dependent hydrolase (beta-lactamase superfamily II)